MATKQTPPRRTDVIRCENCGEDYSVTYKRCPFCDERPGKSYPAIGGRRVAGGGSGGRQPNPLQLVMLVVSLILIVTALFIVFKSLAPLFGNKDPDTSTPPSSQSQGAVSTPPAGSQTPGASSSGDLSQPDLVVPTVTALSLNKTDITLTPKEVTQLVATVAPADVPVTWSSSDETALQVAQDGTLTNVNASGSLVKVTVTVTAGDKTAQCTVYCKSAASGSTTPPSGGSGTTTTPSAQITPGTDATIVNAGGGLNIRSGPGTSYSVQASTTNGATVTVLEDAGDGWYKIKYSLGNGKYEEGYVAKDYVAAK